MSETKLKFRLEHRGDVDVLVFDDGGIRPATDAEIALWEELGQVDAHNRIAQLEAEVERLVALNVSWGERYGIAEAERDAAFKKGMERAAELCENYDDDGGAGESWRRTFATAIRAAASEQEGKL